MSDVMSSNYPTEINRRQAEKVVVAQLMVGLALGGLFWVLAGQQAGVSALAGCLISVIPSWFFARWLFAGGPLSADRFFKRAVAGELLKIAITAAMFLVAIAVFKFAFLPLISVFAVSLIVYWFALLLA